jgi:hypothetical protein
MAFKTVTGNALDIKNDETPHVGVYVGKQEISTPLGPQVVWQFESLDGDDKFGIYGFTNLNRVMSVMALGSLVRITYKGTQRRQTRFGLKDVHQVLVEVDDEFKKDVPF